MIGSLPISAATGLAAVIGHPVRHSLSPTIHNAAYRAMGLDWVYAAFDVAPGGGGDAVEAMRTFALVGMNVTMPHKADVARAVDALAGDAGRLGAANCVVPDGGRLIGHNTDGDGFIDTLHLDEGIDPAGMHVVVIGAGGAARSVIAALARSGASVTVVNRTGSRAIEAAALAGERGRVGTSADVASADLVVNATPVGMGDGVTPEAGTMALPFDPDLLGAGAVVAELVYHPPVTPLMAEAMARGARAVGGLGMLVHQAARAIELWSGQSPPVDVMWVAARDRLGGQS